MTMPEAPRNVIAHMPDGQRIPIDLIYVGVNAEGLHLWEAVTVLPDKAEHVTIDELPGRTKVQLRARGA